MVTGITYNIQRFSVQDGPGVRSLVFLKGCPLRCLWCCNPESQNTGRDLLFHPARCTGCGRCKQLCPAKAITGCGNIDRERCKLCGVCVEGCYAGALELAGKEQSVDEVMQEVLRDLDIYRNSGGGVTFSGGEPAMQPEFVLALLRVCKENGIHTAMETCGYAPQEVYERLLPYVDLFLYDIKHMNSESHRKLTGGPNELILKNFTYLQQAGKDIIARLPLIPGCNLEPENIRDLGGFLQLNHIRKVHLLPYHKLGINKYASLSLLYNLSDTSDVSDDELHRIKDILEKSDCKVTIYNH